MLLYRALRWLLGLAVRVFFRRIEVVGLEHVPRDGPVIFCGNHPNSLLDPVLITVFCGRIVHFAAKDVLFKSRPLRPVLRAMGAVPVQRRKDHADGQLDNQSAFDALFDVLATGRAMGIFPEGISHNESQLQGLKTGAARIALGLDKKYPDVPVRLVPCGLNYIHRHRFRSSVLVQFGEPITVTRAWRAASTEDSRAAARDLTGVIDEGMRALTVNAEDWETLRVIDGVRRLYQPEGISLEQRVELARRFNAEYPKVKDEPVVAQIFGRVQDYLNRLNAAGLNDRDLRRAIRTGEVIWRTLAQLLFIGFWLPLAAIGALVHLPMLILVALFSERLSPRKDVVGTTKFLFGFLGINAAYLAFFIWSGYRWGWYWALGLMLFVPISGLATLKVAERYVAFRQLIMAALRMLTLRRELRALKHTRQLLVLAVEEALDRFIPADMERLFPREAPDDLC